MVVVDTHAWIWWTDDPARLSALARNAIDEADAVGVPAICCWELAMLVLGGRITLDRDPSKWAREALALPRVLAMPIEPKIALEAALLDQDHFPADPADRLIYATARHTGARLVTRDGEIRAFDPRGTVW